MESGASSNKQAKLLWIAATVAIAAVCLYVRWRLIALPLERDEGEYAYIGQLMLKGIAPWAAAYSMKLPGASAVYALAMAVFGETPTGVHVGLMLVNGASALLVGLLGRRLFGTAAGFAAGASYAALSLSFSVLGAYAHATQCVVLFSVGGLLLLLRYLDSGRRTLLFASGLLLGLAFVTKQHAVVLVPFALAYLLCRRKDAVAGRPAALAESLVLLAGSLLPFALLVLVLVAAGVFPTFRFWTVTYAASYVSGVTAGQGWTMFTAELARLADTQLLLWLAAGAGAACAFGKRWTPGRRLFLAGYLVASLLAVAPGFYFRPHYFVLLLPAVSLMIGAAASTLGRGRTTALAAPVVLLALAACGFYAERENYFSRSPLEVSRAVSKLNPFPEAVVIADYLRRHSSPTDKVAVLGSEPEIYFYADRVSATGHIYMYGLMENHPFAERMQREMIREVEAAQPAYLVMVVNNSSWLVTPSSPALLLQWMDRYCAENYRPVGFADISPDGTRYVWDGAAAGYQPASPSFVVVYRRK